MKLDFLFGNSGDGGGSARARPDMTIFTGAAPPRPLDDASRVIRVGLIVAGGFFGLLFLFSFIAPISGAAVATGEVTTSGTRIVIQPEAGGVVRQLFVSEGQFVKAGQPLVRLNGVRSAAAAQQAQAKRDALRALQSRLIAERDNAETLIFSADLTQRSADPVAASAMAAQRVLFERHRAIMLADRQISETERAAAQAQRTSALKQLALIRDELGGVRALYKKGYARKTQLRALERAAAQLEAEVSTGSGTVARTNLESARLVNEQMMQIVTQLAQVEEQLAQADPALRVTRYDAERDLLRAPVAGRVSGVARVGPGSVLGSGQTVMEVIPANRTLIVETHIKPSDIDDVHVGSPATLRFSTVNPHGRSAFDGKVVALSPARIAGQEGQPDYFRAQISVTDSKALQRAGVSLQPGVPVTIHVKTRDRTLFNYLFSPVEDALSAGFREE